MSGVRFRALTFRKMGASSKSGASLPLYKQILSKMPKELKESLVCWYSPNLQGLTNAEFYNSDNLYIGGLHDLSGNGHDMTLYGFAGVEGGGHVDEEGNLVFDGVDDYGLSSAVSLSQYNDICSIYNAYITSGNGYPLSWSSSAGITFEIGYASVMYVRHRGVSQAFSKKYGDICVIINNPTFYVNDEIKEVEVTTNLGDIPITLGRKYNKSSYKQHIFYNFVTFNRHLADSEIEWVKTNMLISQEVKNHNVGLWVVDDDSGEFYCIDTIKVQSGNMIGKYDEDGNLILPIYDVDSTHQTSLQWYTDADCTEEYFGEYITEDTFMYAKKEPKLQ